LVDRRALREELAGWYSSSRIRRMVAAYEAAGVLTDDEVGALARLDDTDRGRAFAVKYLDDGAYKAAASDFQIRSGH
jgi:hypothetical protein